MRHRDNESIEFEWDEGNIDKNYKKHGVTPNETEEVFLDEQVIIVADIDHSQHEKRDIAIGQTLTKKMLCIVFTSRKEKIRIISARSANKKERRIYESTVETHS